MNLRKLQSIFLFVAFHNFNPSRVFRPVQLNWSSKVKGETKTQKRKAEGTSSHQPAPQPKKKYKVATADNSTISKQSRSLCKQGTSSSFQQPAAQLTRATQTKKKGKPLTADVSFETSSKARKPKVGSQGAASYSSSLKKAWLKGWCFIPASNLPNIRKDAHSTSCSKIQTLPGQDVSHTK